jgi:hypothetical protein
VGVCGGATSRAAPAVLSAIGCVCACACECAWGGGGVPLLRPSPAAACPRCDLGHCLDCRSRECTRQVYAPSCTYMYNVDTRPTPATNRAITEVARRTCMVHEAKPATFGSNGSRSRDTSETHVLVLCLAFTHRKARLYHYNVAMGFLMPKRWVYYPGHSYNMLLCCYLFLLLLAACH